MQIEGEQITEAVRTITWNGGPVGPGEFHEFDMSVGSLLEDVDSLTFPAMQTYSSGEVVRWIEESEPGRKSRSSPRPFSSSPPPQRMVQMGAPRQRRKPQRR